MSEKASLLPMSFRATHDLRSKLEKAAVRSGRSLTQEIERRLEQSFDRSDMVRALRKELERKERSQCLE